jgi:hypothetical protein
LDGKTHALVVVARNKRTVVCTEMSLCSINAKPTTFRKWACTDVAQVGNPRRPKVAFGHQESLAPCKTKAIERQVPAISGQWRAVSWLLGRQPQRFQGVPQKLRFRSAPELARSAGLSDADEAPFAAYVDLARINAVLRRSLQAQLQLIRSWALVHLQVMWS